MERRASSGTEPQSVVDWVTASLREGIQERTYPPGMHLVERVIATTMGVSSIAVREAFGRLANEGIVVQKARRGAFVASLTADTVRDLARVRIALEHLVVESAIANWSEDSTTTMQQIVDEMCEASDAKDSTRFFNLDTEFHDTLWRIAKSPILLEIADLLRGRLAGFLRQSIHERSREQLIEFAGVHQRWLDGIAGGDVDLATKEVERQINATADDISESLKDDDQHRLRATPGSPEKARPSRRFAENGLDFLGTG
jgi:DNA-binding GntR family transcriptional regulator